VTPPNGIVLDPFMGSGSTAVASIRENFNFVGIEMLREHFETAKRRVTVERGKIKS
jgi:site-specific DNA-methyltransferase (adenine-specific)